MTYQGLLPGEQQIALKAFPKWEFGTIENNQKIIDPLLGFGCFMLGFKRHDLIDCVTEKLKQDVYESGECELNQSGVPRLYDSVFELSNRFYQITGGYKSIFSLSGSDANEGAIKLAAAYHNIKKTKRFKIIGFTNSYHGSTFLNYNIGRAFMESALYNLKPYTPVQLIEKEFEIDQVDWSEVMCIIVETRAWCDKLKRYPVDFWEKIKLLQNKHDIILIIDDIFIGGGKTGNWMGWKHMDIQPDIFTQGKAITGGYFPLANTLYSQKIDSVIPDNFKWDHGFSYSFHSAGILSCLKYMDILEKENLLTQVSQKKTQAELIFKNNNCKMLEELGLMYALKYKNKKYLITIPLTADHEYWQILNTMLLSSTTRTKEE